MSGEILKISAMQEIMTPYGPGIAVGKVVDADGLIRGILVSLDVRKVTLPEELRPKHNGPCYLLEYKLEQLKIADARLGYRPDPPRRRGFSGT